MMSSTDTWVLSVDGAARNNPGPAGAGIYLTRNGVVVLKRGFYLGTKTNNQAEYLALILGVYLAKEEIPSHVVLHVRTDSELLVKQLLGIYNVRKKHLIPLYQKVKALLELMTYHIEHVPRVQNSMADALANQGIDQKVLVPQSFLHIWPVYDCPQDDA